MSLEPILVRQKALEREVTQSVNVFEDELSRDRISLEELVKELSRYCIILGHRAKHFDHLG